jgi:toxin YhaV
MRAYESGDDAYRVFRKMLENGHPPDDWEQLLAQATESESRWKKVASQASR